ncbi:MAG TPA: hypothetical protein VFI77_01920, partial [Gemmatimonadales bacterium]|nr:hypothetical protein [Gemmatimonadales bacterium]
MAIRPRWTSVYMGCWVLSTALMLVGCDPGSSTPPLGPADEPTAALAGDALSLGRGGVRGGGGGGGRWPKTIVSISVSPDTTLISPSRQQAFKAQGRTSKGNLVDLDVDWSATGGAIDTTGTYKAGTTPGRFYVKGRTADGLADSAVVDITPGVDTVAIQAVVLTPALDTVGPGGTATFAASGRLPNGSSAPVDVTYSASGGTISAAGLYQAGSQTGRYRVIATDDALGLADTAVVVIAAPTLSQLTLTPASTSLLAGGTQQFAVTGLLSDGTTATVSAAFTAQGGTIDGSGLYTAGGTAGNYRVIATAGGLADTATVTITVSVPSGDGEPAVLAD